MEYYLTNDELYHHGILGMKWGVRRFQNPDGTLTAEGKRRYRVDENGKYIKRTRAERKAYDKKVKALKAAAEAKKVKSPRSKDIKQLSDKQLQKYIDRMQNEKRAIELRNDINRLDPKPLTNGEKFTKYLIENVVTPVAQDAGKKFLDAVMKNATKTEPDKYAQAKKDAEYWKNVNTAKQQKDQYEKNLANDNKNKKANEKSKKVKDFLKSFMLDDDDSSGESSGQKTEFVKGSGGSNKKAEPKSNNSKGPSVVDAEFKVKNEQDVYDFVASFYQEPYLQLGYDPNRRR